MGDALVLMEHLAQLLVALRTEDLVELGLVCAQLLLTGLVQLLQTSTVIDKYQDRIILHL